MSQSNRAKKILVPVDLSEICEQAIPYADQLADQDAELHLVHVNQPMMVYAHAGGTVPPDSTQVAPTMEQAQAQLDRISVSSDLNEKNIKRIVLEGTPASAIVDYAKDNQIDLIVMTTHGTTGIARLLMGSVAEHVIRKAPCPVLTLKTTVWNS